MENTELEQAPMQQEVASRDLTIADLNNIRSVFDVAVRRGAFVAAEMSSVGALYDKLNTFLNSLEGANPPAPPAGA